MHVTNFSAEHDVKFNNTCEDFVARSSPPRKILKKASLTVHLAMVKVYVVNGFSIDYRQTRRRLPPCSRSLRATLTFVAPSGAVRRFRIMFVNISFWSENGFHLMFLS